MKYYTVLDNGKLHTSCIDDMNSTASWAIGGMIFLSKKKARDYIKSCKKYDEFHGSKVDRKIVEIKLNKYHGKELKRKK